MSRWRLDPGQIEVVDEAVAEILRKKTPAERVALVSDAYEFARQLIEGGLRTQHPNWTDGQVHAELLKRMSREAS